MPAQDRNMFASSKTGDVYTRNILAVIDESSPYMSQTSKRLRFERYSNPIDSWLSIRCRNIPCDDQFCRRGLSFVILHLKRDGFC